MSRSFGAQQRWIVEGRNAALIHTLRSKKKSKKKRLDCEIPSFSILSSPVFTWSLQVFRHIWCYRYIWSGYVETARIWIWVRPPPEGGFKSANWIFHRHVNRTSSLFKSGLFLTSLRACKRKYVLTVNATTTKTIALSQPGGAACEAWDCKQKLRLKKKLCNRFNFSNIFLTILSIMIKNINNGSKW